MVTELMKHPVHISGLKVHPQGGRAGPDDGTVCTLNPEEHVAMTWTFEDLHDQSREVSIYGKPILTGEWKIVNEILNPIATHEVTFTIKKGKSKTESSSHSFQFKFETSFEAKAEFMGSGASNSMSTSFQRDVQNSSSETWSDETTVTRKIHGLYIYSICLFLKIFRMVCPS